MNEKELIISHRSSQHHSHGNTFTVSYHAQIQRDATGQRGKDPNLLRGKEISQRRNRNHSINCMIN